MSDRPEASSPSGSAQSSAEAAKGASVQAGDTARQIGDQARQAGAQAVNTAREVAGEAQSRGASLAGDVSERVISTASGQKDALAEQIEDAAHAVHRAGAQLEGHQDWLAHLVERGAAELGVLAQSLRSNDFRSLMGNVDDLARRQPALFMGASLAAGFALARVGRVAVSSTTQADLPHRPEPLAEKSHEQR